MFFPLWFSAWPRWLRPRPRRPTKVAIIHIQNAILQTKDGQKAASELQAKFAPKKAELEKKQADIAQPAGPIAQGQRHHER